MHYTSQQIALNMSIKLENTMIAFFLNIYIIFFLKKTFQSFFIKCIPIFITRGTDRDKEMRPPGLLTLLYVCIHTHIHTYAYIYTPTVSIVYLVCPGNVCILNILYTHPFSINHIFWPST